MNPTRALQFGALAFLLWGSSSKPLQAAPLSQESSSTPSPAELAETAGSIPPDTSPEARALWQKFLAAQRTRATASEAIRSFQLGFDLRVREPGSSKDVRASFDYLVEGGWLRFRMDSSRRESLHGPKGDWLIDQYGTQRMRGKDFKRDLRQLREFGTIARNFVSLTRPEGIRLVSLATYEGPGRALPAPLDALATELLWLEARSPDLRLVSVGEDAKPLPANTIFRARLGLDAESGRIRLAILSEDTASGAADSLLVHVRAWAELDSYRVPSELLLHRSAERAFSPHAHAELFLLPGGLLNAPLKPEDFNPQE